MNITNITKKITIEIQKSGVVNGRIETSRESIKLSGKIGGLYLGEFGKKLNPAVQKILPFKIELITNPVKSINNVTDDMLVNFFNFWKKAVIIGVIGTTIWSDEGEKIYLGIEGLIGKSYSSFAKHDEIIFRKNLSEVTMLKTKNVPGLVDVEK